MFCDKLETLLSSPHRIRQATTYALMIVVVAAVILPVFSPSIGQHPIERLPGHGHIYPGGVPLDHLHSHELVDHHGNSAPVVDSNGIVYLPPNTDATAGKSFNVVPAILAIPLMLTLPSVLVYAKLNLDIFPTAFTPSVETPPPQPAF